MKKIIFIITLLMIPLTSYAQYHTVTSADRDKIAKENEVREKPDFIMSKAPPVITESKIDLEIRGAFNKYFYRLLSPLESDKTSLKEFKVRLKKLDTMVYVLKNKCDKCVDEKKAVFEKLKLFYINKKNKKHKKLILEYAKSNFGEKKWRNY